MTTNIANALFGYFATLYDLNRNLINLCGFDVLVYSGHFETLAQSVIQAIPRLIPYAYDKNKKVYTIMERDGLLEYSNEISFIKEDYENILRDNYGFLANIKIIRNKYEHKIHGVRIIAGANSDDSIAFSLTYEVNEKRILLLSDDIISFVMELNTLFSKIQNEVSLFAIKEGKTLHPYYLRLNRYCFSSFNLIYESNVLKSVGAALFPF